MSKIVKTFDFDKVFKAIYKKWTCYKKIHKSYEGVLVLLDHFQRYHVAFGLLAGYA